VSHIDRRRFLTTAAAVSLAGAVSSARGAVAAADRPKRRFTMDLSCGMIGVGADQRRAIRLAHEHGFESVAPATDFLVRLSDDELQELLADMKGKNLVWGAASLPVDFRRDQSRFAAGLKGLPELAAGLKRAGVTRVGTWIMPTHRRLTYLANFRQHAQRLRQVAKVLGDHGQRLGLEYVGPKTSWTAETKELIAEIGQQNVGLMLDSWHWYNARETADDLLTLANRDVVCCHLNDAPAGVPIDQQRDGRRELPCATGVIDLKAFLGSLVKIGYDGPISAEPFSRALRAMPAEEAVAATAAAMKKAFALVE
jgi:sugar phosphate isomerase/epimerase